jgi:O-antigen/teichoic acid export membrane protein
LGNLLIGIGETKIWMKLNILTLCIGVPLAFMLIPTLEIVGVILCVLIAGVPSMFIGLHLIWKRYGAKADFGCSAKILVASLISVLATYLLLNVFNAVDWVKLTAGLVLFIAVYLIGAPVVGAINQADIDNLRSMFSGLGLVSKLTNMPLTFMEKTLQIRPKRVEMEC